MIKEYIFNPLYNKIPKSSCEQNNMVTFTLKVAKRICPLQVFFALKKDEDDLFTYHEMKQIDIDFVFKTYQIVLPFKDIGLYWYHFKIEQYEHTFYLQKDDNFNVEPVGEVKSSFAQIVNTKFLDTLPSFKDGIMYHVFVDRFNKVGKAVSKKNMVYRKDWCGDLTKNTTDLVQLNKEYFGGNLKGIESKLDYFKKLNITTLYLSPIFESSSYHKYDTADYSKIDSAFGGQEAFDSLCSKAKEKGISVILDGVFNHTGSDSIYFNKDGNYKSLGAYQDTKSPYYDWYFFKNFPNDYSSWWGIKTLPQTNDNCKSFRDYIAGKNGIISKNMKNVLGFRLDVVDELGENFLKDIYKSIKTSNKKGVVIGEVWEDASTKIAYGKRREYFLGNELNSVINYPLKNAIFDYITSGNEQELLNVITMELTQYPEVVQNNLMNVIGTHDTKRVISVLDEAIKVLPNQYPEGIKPFDLLKIASTIQFTLFGVPCIFYGDEIGLKGSDAPFCRQCFPWDNMDKNILNWFIKLSKIRKSPLGNFEIVYAGNGVFVYKRTNKDKTIVVGINCGKDDFEIDLKGSYIDLEKSEKYNSIILKPYSSCILLSK